uniref:Hexosyltransferase n=1 Tax=Noctiluca scintillans TaxID=2966 RepID=A0A7S1F8G9_NOCSC|mmetsp:Transcript_4139/g.11676  ORF Transcript_4139/g.11676 Transcript_4139/m.11676 type:complete len:347 (+) Transcript_4139:81-1121(+)|eukprot:CAMPEP_0194531270 /NCGR_PEP_ID=MMETSP0253-20130528/68535_1 /TAXON_ID=2966 /ORGANISM="Noctiluca scintillans" /LENGTH=346 /DNA_ID=CAMNT_0039376605 /DNA_START=10 /DNA_END=1050 /DNA_ORIENTATION=+
MLPELTFFVQRLPRVSLACAFLLVCTLPLQLRNEIHFAQRALPPLWPTLEPHCDASGTNSSSSGVLDEAYAFMLYGDFPGRSLSLYDCCKGFLVAVHSIRKFDQRRPIILLSAAPPIAERTLLDRLGVETRTVSLVRPPNIQRCVESLGTDKKRLLDSFTKLHVWELTEFRTVLYVEFDTLILAPMDILFQKLRCVAGANALGMAPIGHRTCAAKDWSVWQEQVQANTGVLIVRPSTEFARRYAQAVGNGSFSCDSGSQSLENVLLDEVCIGGKSKTSQCLCIPNHEYNCKDDGCLKTALLVHWSGERKPWDGPQGWPQAFPLWNAAWDDLLRFACGDSDAPCHRT